MYHYASLLGRYHGKVKTESNIANIPSLISAPWMTSDISHVFTQMFCQIYCFVVRWDNTPTPNNRDKRKGWRIRLVWVCIKLCWPGLAGSTPMVSPGPIVKLFSREARKFIFGRRFWSTARVKDHNYKK